VVFDVLRSRGSDRDLEIIFDHLAGAFEALGDPADTAFARAADRIRRIEDDMASPGRAPIRGTLREELMPGLRQVTKDRAIIYFLTDEAEGQVRILAIFFGGRDHLGHMLRRLRGGP